MTLRYYVPGYVGHAVDGLKRAGYVATRGVDTVIVDVPRSISDLHFADVAKIIARDLRTACGQTFGLVLVGRN